MIEFNGKDYNPKVNNHTSLHSVKGNVMDDVTELITKVYNSAQSRITDVGPCSLRIEQKNTNPVKYLDSYGVTIKPASTEDKAARVVKFFAKNESKTLEHESKDIISGTRNEILKYLKTDEFKTDLQNYIDNVSDKFYLNNNR